MDFNTEYKQNLIKKFEEKKYGKSKDKQLSSNSINLYIRNLEKLNDDMPIKNLNFLRNIETIKKKIENYKENTKRGYLISICSALSTEKDNKNKEKLYNEYYKLLSEKNNELKNQESKNELTEKQNENWITWDDVKKKFLELEEKVNSFKNSKEINIHNYNILLQYIVLALYFYKQPRRNQDYYKMIVIKKYKPNQDVNNNYLSIDDNEFIFNVFKTSKKEGMQKEKIPDELNNIIKLYFKYHPLIKCKKIKINEEIPFLVYYNGDKFDKVNSITRILNKIFDKSIGSSMLRHIYLSNKYGDVLKEQKKDAEAMGHSVNQQKDYVKILN
jgi:hypothetical protein